LWDIYPHADLVTYPSLYEGFGNALIETFYFRKPVVVNRYSIFVQDIEPKGFETVAMNGYVTHDVVTQTKALLADENYRREMTETNYELGLKYYGYGELRKKMAALFTF
jgi:hypothetical protein